MAPLGSDQNRRASVSLTIATGCAAASSRLSNSRPASSPIVSVRKYSGATTLVRKARSSPTPDA